jgi:hypothetical protein
MEGAACNSHPGQRLSVSHEDDERRRNDALAAFSPLGSNGPRETPELLEEETAIALRPFVL